MEIGKEYIISESFEMPEQMKVEREKLLKTLKEPGLIRADDGALLTSGEIIYFNKGYIAGMKYILELYKD